MKKIILILFILLCGISAVAAQTAQRTVKKPNFFMPQNAMQSQTSQNRTPQVRNTSTAARTTAQTAKTKTQPTAKIVKPARTNAQKTASATTASNGGVIKRAVKTPSTVTSKPQPAKINRPASGHKQPTPAQKAPVQAPVETAVINVVPVQNPQPTPVVNPDDPFQIIFIDYFKDTAAIDAGQPYQNPRLDSVIASFVDQEHIMN